MNTSQKSVCPVCNCKYDLAERLPRIFISCGHTVCTSCFTSYIVDDNIICPLDGNTTPTFGKGIEVLPPNYALKKLINEEDSEFGVCEEHDERIRLVCLDDQCLVCDDCANYGSHKGHRIKPLKKVEVDAKEKIDRIEKALDKHDGYWKGLHKIFEDTRLNLQKMVKEEFQNLRWLLFMKELEISYEIESFFSSEITKTNDTVGSNSTLRRGVVDKKNTFKEWLANKKFLNIAEEDITPILESLNFESSQRKTQDLIKGFQETLESFNTALITRVQPFIVLLEFPTDDLRSMLDGIFSEENEEILKRKLHHGDSSRRSSSLDQDRRAIYLDRVQMDDVRNFTAKCMNDQDKEAVNKVIQPFWQQVKDALSIKVDYSSNQISDREFFDCCLVIAWSSMTLQKFDISLKDSSIKEYSIIPLVGEILPRMSSLKTMRIDLSKTRTTDRSLNAFPKKALASLQFLEDLELDLSKTAVTDITIIELSGYLQNIRNLTLDLDSTHIGNEGLNAIAHHALPSIRALDSLKLDFSSTQITDEAVIQLFNALKNIKRFTFNASWTKITNNCIDAFIMYALPHLKSFESLELNFWGTSIAFETVVRLFASIYNRKYLDSVTISDKVLRIATSYPLSVSKNIESLDVDLSTTGIADHSVIPLFSRMETLQVLRVNLSYTNITKATLEALTRTTISSIKALQVLKINLSSTMVSDEGVKLLFDRLQTVSTLRLNFSGTMITNLSIDHLLRNTIPTMRSLKKFELDVSNTQVTLENQRIISQLQDRYNQA